MSKLSTKRINSIERYRKRVDLRGRNKLPEIHDVYKVRLYSIYNQEINSVKSSLNKFVVPLLPLLIVREDADNSVFDQFQKAFKMAIKTHFGSIIKGNEPDTIEYSKQVSRKVKPLFNSANKDHERQFDKYYEKIAGVDPISSTPQIKDLLSIASQENVQKITTVSEDYFSKIESSVFQAMRSGSSNKTVVEEIEKIIQVTGNSKKSNAKLIATDQIQKLNGDLDRIRQKANGGFRYIWRTRNNGSVRHDHEILDGAIFDWGNKPITVSTGSRAGERNEPGQDINCKCRAEMVIEDALEIRNSKIEKAEAKTQKLIDKGIL
jgi:SPP1 gp7 family putative phage head morphogenesis protein